MTDQNILDIRDALNSDEGENVPFAVVKDQNIAVFGDVNETAIQKRDYTIQFQFPVETSDGVQYKYHEKVYKDVFIKPIQQTKVVRLLAQLYPYFKTVVDGEVKELSDEALINIVASMEDRVIDTMYTLVAQVLGIDEELKDYMMGGSVITAAIQLIKSNPSAKREAAAFFK